MWIYLAMWGSGGGGENVDIFSYVVEVKIWIRGGSENVAAFMSAIWSVHVLQFCFVGLLVIAICVSKSSTYVSPSWPL